MKKEMKLFDLNYVMLPGGIFRGGEQRDKETLPKGTFRSGEQRDKETLPKGTFRGGEQRDKETLPKGTFRSIVCRETSPAHITLWEDFARRNVL